MLDKNDEVCYNESMDPPQGRVLTPPERQNPLKVVYDVDDVLWCLNRRVFERLGLDYTHHTNYHIYDNPHYSTAEADAAIAAFGDATNFEDMEFLPGADAILAVEPLGAEVYIHSNCYSQAVADMKLPQLRRLLPDLAPSRIRLSLTSFSRDKKHIDQDAFILVDDGPHNIARSTAQINIVPYRPWNASPAALSEMTTQAKTVVKDWSSDLSSIVRSQCVCIIPAHDLLEANQIVQQAVKIKQELNHA